jgi:sugar (pentulose or hexulose) kinase
VKNKLYLAIDNGASGGRAVLGRINEQRLSIEEINRYHNQMINIFDHYYWDVLTLFQKIKDSLKKCAALDITTLGGIGLDNWGVDFCLLGRDGSLLGCPFAYRDRKNEEVFEEVFKLITRKRIYEITGIQILQYNPLFGLYALAQMKHPTFELADTFLFIADLFNYYLSGVKGAEFSLASGSQLYDNNDYCWSKELFDVLGLPFNITPDLIEPATVLGELYGGIKEESGIKSAKVIAPLTHDTGSAVTAIPLRGPDWAFLSSGTWSALGTVEKKPVINELSFHHNFTNEGGLYRSVRFLKNITGLWLLQECRRDWEKEGALYTYDQLVEMAKRAKPLQSIIYPDDPSFFNPSDMPGEIIAYCKKTNQNSPDNRGEIVRTILESLALIYRNRLEIVERIKGSQVQGLHIVGGGAQNTLLNQFVANCIQRPVLAGPVEATAIGNIIVQAMADGFLSDINEGHTLICNSFDILSYEPDIAQKTLWDDAYEQFLNLKNYST